MWWALLLACPKPMPAPAPPPAAELLLVTPNVAISVRAGAIDAVLPEPSRLQGPQTVVLHGDLVSAGFVDAHAHPAGLGSSLAQLDLRGVASYAQALDRIGDVKGNGWVLGRGWDQNDWPDAPAAGWPLAADLDRVQPGRPVALVRVDGHALWVSSEALRRTGFGDGSLVDPAGGRVVRDAEGIPTGVLLDEAMAAVPWPEPSDEAAERQLREALRVIVHSGLTGVHAMGVSDRSLGIYTRLAQEDALPLRIWAYVAADSQAAERLLAEGPWGRGRLAVVGIKVFADGALGSRGALLSSPYTDDPGQSGLSLTSGEDLTALAIRCLRARVQLAVHAIGDAAVTRTLDAFEAARAAVPESVDVPLRVEHAQLVRPEDRPRFAALNVVASMQPTHATSDMPWAEARLGPERVQWAYSWRSLAEAGATLALGSDFPVEQVDPGLGLWSAVTRRDLDGQPAAGWQIGEALSLPEAIEGFTRGAARAVGSPGGEITVGAPADITLWRAERVAGFDRYYAVATVVGGEVVWAASLE